MIPGEGRSVTTIASKPRASGDDPVGGVGPVVGEE